VAQFGQEKDRAAEGISFFQKYLSVWVALCMVVGVLLGRWLPGIGTFLNRFEYYRVSIPMAILIWIMIYPMMMKVDFKKRAERVGKNPKGLYVTWITNWLIKPFSMYGIASLFFFVIFKSLIAPELATQYLAGAVLLGAAPCTAMVFVWSTLTKGTRRTRWFRWPPTTLSFFSRSFPSSSSCWASPTSAFLTAR
jgi:ACR3 family arsenite transporter